MRCRTHGRLVARLTAVAAVACTLTSPVSGHAAPRVPWSTPATHVVMVNPPFSASDVRSNIRNFAPEDGTPAVYVYTSVGTGPTVLELLNALYPGAAGALPPDQRADLAGIRTAGESTLLVAAKASLADMPGVVRVKANSIGVCADPNNCSYYLYTLRSEKPSGTFNNLISTLQDTWMYENDGGKPSLSQNNFIFHSDVGDNWTSGFFRNNGFINRSFSGEFSPGVWEYRNQSFAQGSLSPFSGDISPSNILTLGMRTSTTITTASCNTVTQAYSNGSKIVYKLGAAAKDTWGLSGWNSAPLEGYPNDSRAPTFLMDGCDSLNNL
jgi:hypothetical protein